MRLTAHHESFASIAAKCINVEFVISRLLVAQVGALVHPIHWSTGTIVENLHVPIFYCIIYEGHAIKFWEYQLFLLENEWRHFPVIFSLIKL